MRTSDIKASAILKAAVLAACLILFGAGASFAQQTINLTAAPTSTTLPDGTTVPMWGYFCGTTVAGTTATCAALNPASAPPITTPATWSPVLITVPYNSAGTALTINLTNSLSFTPVGTSTANTVPTSIIIAGQVGGGLGSVSQRTTTPSPDHSLAQGCATWFIASGATPPGTPCPAAQGRGLNWDPYGHHPVSSTSDPLATLGCTPDVEGYNTGDPTALNFFEWCQDHNKPVEVNPFGDVPAGGPITLPDPNVFTNGAWYGGTPYLGPDASLRASMPTCQGSPYGIPNPTTPSGGVGTPPVDTAGCTTLLPSNVQANPANERGWAFMWHSHNEREITTNNVFPGGMLMMMLVDTREFVIDETL